MKTPAFPLLFLTLGLALATGCERRTVVIEIPATPAPGTSLPASTPLTLLNSRPAVAVRLVKAVDTYEQEPSADHHDAVKAALDDLDDEIGKPGQDSDRRTDLRATRVTESGRFAAAQAKAAVKAPFTTPDPNDLEGRTAGRQFKDAVKAPFTTPDPNDPENRTGGRKIKDGAEEVGGAIKDAAKDVGSAIKGAVTK